MRNIALRSRSVNARLAAMSKRTLEEVAAVESKVMALAGGTRDESKRTSARTAKRGNGGKRVVITQQRSETILEHFRRVYLSMQVADGPEVVPSIGVTSAVEDEGRTTVATGIAAAMAADLDVPIVLLEADLGHPGLHRVLGLAPHPGLCEYLRGECELATVLRHVSDSLFVLPAGDAKGEAPRLIRQLVTGDIRSRLEKSGAVLVVDLPPILAASYGVLASTMAESIAFVVRAGVTTDDQVKDALARLDETIVRGIVLNGAQPQLPGWLRGRV